MKRRDFLAASAVGGAAAAGLSRMSNAQPAAPSGAGGAGGAEPLTAPKLKGRIKHSVCQWCFDGIDLDVLCRDVKAMGYSSVELVGVAQWPVLAKHGLTCAVAVGPTKIPKGFNRVENHAPFLKRMEEMLPRTADAGCPMMIVFSGNNAGITDDEGLKNCVTGLKEAVKLAEQSKVTLVMELLNSKIDHPDYMCRHTKWGVELVERVGSDRFKLLYDIYHMQIMEGDVIRTIQDNIKHIAHFHTAGVPGRHEIEEEQELNYRAICKAIADTGYSGYIAQEFIPQRRANDSLRRAIEICDQ
jgi:hydroxypyruvate isomerase